MDKDENGTEMRKRPPRKRRRGGIHEFLGPAGTRQAMIVFFSALLLLLSTAGGGCGGNPPEAAEKVREAVGIISSSRELLEDLLVLDQRFNSLGQRYPSIEDTLAEGRSLAEMALVNVEELESRYTRARDLLREAADAEEAGKHRDYALLALDAVEPVLEAVRLNRELLDDVHDMLDVIPMAESADQLSYYVEEIGRLTEEISELLGRGAQAAEVADDYSREHGL